MKSIYRCTWMLSVTMLTIAVSVASADDADCPDLKAYSIGTSGIVRLTWPQSPDALKKPPDPNQVRYTVFRGTAVQQLTPISITASLPVTNVVLDQVQPGATGETYQYRVQIDTLDPTTLAVSSTITTKTATVSVPALQAKTLIAQPFDDNRLDPNQWVLGNPATALMIEEGKLVLGAGAVVSVPLSSMSGNGIEIVARVKATYVKAPEGKTPFVDQIAAAIGFETADAKGYVLKLALHDYCGKKQVRASIHQESRDRRQ